MATKKRKSKPAKPTAAQPPEPSPPPPAVKPQPIKTKGRGKKAKAEQAGSPERTLPPQPVETGPSESRPPKLEREAWVVPDGCIPKFPYGDSPSILHRLTEREVAVLACEFGTTWGIGKPWVPDEAFWMGCCRFKLISEYGYKDSDLPSLSVSAICDLFRYSYRRDVKVAMIGSPEAKAVCISRGQMRFYRDAAELTREREEIGHRVYDLLRNDAIRKYWFCQIELLLDKLHQYDQALSDDTKANCYDVRDDPMPFRGGYRLLDLTRERPAVYVVIVLCLTSIGGKDVVADLAAEMKIRWAGIRWQSFFGKAAMLDIYLKDVEEDLRRREPLCEADAGCLDLSIFKNGRSRKLLLAYLEDDGRQGVDTTSEQARKKYGDGQPRTLKKVLKAKAKQNPSLARLQGIADKIVPVPGKRHHFKLDIPYSEIEYKAPD